MLRRTITAGLWVSLLPCAAAFAADATIVPGGTWRDNNGNLIEAHDGGIIKVGSVYYLYGNDRTYYNSGSGPFDRAFYRLNMYSSTDLANWTFVNSILTYQSAAALNGNIVERPKIIYNSSTGKYVLWFHYDSYNYSTAHVGVATCDTVGGNYTYITHFAPEGRDSRDMTAYKDDDGSAYLICATNSNSRTTIFKLASDYLSVASTVTDALSGEGISVFKKDGLYYIILSGLTGWGHNNNWYRTASSLAGPWSGNTTLADTGTNTYESQITFTLPVTGSQGTTYMYMGDRWVNGTVNSRYVWLPLKFTGTAMHMDWYASWNINAATGTWSTSDVSATPTSDMVISGPGDAATYTLVLNRAPTQNVTITVTPDAQLEVDKPTLTFTPANWDVPQTVTVTAVDGAGTHAGRITHTAASGDASYNGVALPTVAVTILGGDGVFTAAGFGKKCAGRTAAGGPPTFSWPFLFLAGLLGWATTGRRP